MKSKYRVRVLLAVAATLLPLSAFAGATSELGTLEFPNSGSPEAQEPFIRGVLLLHSFEFQDAAEAFREAQKLDPDFALAYWGEALTHNHPLWRHQGRDEALEILERLGATPEERAAKAPTQREEDYLATLDVLYGVGQDPLADKAERDYAYSEALRQLSENYPKDLEAKAFYALSILGTTGGERDFATFMRAGAVAEEVYAANPRHPGALHYLIHSYDDPIHAPLGLRAARVYAEVAPAAVHAQHMISHIYVALGRWADSIDANVKSFQVSVDRAEAKGLGVDQFNFHALHWLFYSRLQLGQFDLARGLMQDMDGYATESGTNRARWYQAAFHAGWAAETGGSGSLPESGEEELSFSAAVQDHFARGWSALTAGEAGRAREDAEAIESRLQAAVDDPKLFESDRKKAEVVSLELRAGAALAAGNEAEALELLGRATGIERELPLEYGPPEIVKPSFEYLGDVLLGLDRANEAAAAYQTALERAPRRRLSLIGLASAAAATGDEAVRSTACRELEAIYAHADDGVSLPAACEA